MASAASEFLNAWAIARESKTPLTRSDAEALADEWESDAGENGIGRADLDAAAGGDLAGYLLRVFGEAGPDNAFPSATS